MSTTIKQAIDGFLLSCKVEGKSYGTIERYSVSSKASYGMPLITTGLMIYQLLLRSLCGEKKAGN